MQKNICAVHMAENYRFFGGFPEAERTVLGVFPDYMEPLDEEFPVTGSR